MFGPIEQAFRLAIAEGNIQDVKLAVETKGQKINLEHLECAAGSGQCQVMHYLIEKTGFLYNHDLPLLRAFSEGNIDMVDLILGYEPTILIVGSVCQKVNGFLENYWDPHGYDRVTIAKYKAIILKLEQYKDNRMKVALQAAGLEC